jgi:predicted nucleic acid-binding protein
MKVLVDTSVWSLALRKKANRNDAIIRELYELIRELRVIMIGPIRQEILSGISDMKKYEQLRDRLRSFEDVPLETGHYELASHLFNQCRKRGIQGSHIDFIICAASMLQSAPIFTMDKDFEKYKKFVEIQLYTARKDI